MTSTHRRGGGSKQTKTLQTSSIDFEVREWEGGVDSVNVLYGRSLAFHLAAHDELLKFPLLARNAYTQAHSPHPSIRPEEGGNLNRFRGKSTNNRHSSFEGRNGGIDQIKSPNPINGLND